MTEQVLLPSRRGKERGTGQEDSLGLFLDLRFLTQTCQGSVDVFTIADTRVLRIKWLKVGQLLLPAVRIAPSSFRNMWKWELLSLALGISSPWPTRHWNPFHFALQWNPRCSPSVLHCFSLALPPDGGTGLKDYCSFCVCACVILFHKGKM